MIIIAEDRPKHRVGVEIATLSLRRHCPDAELHLHCPWADDDFRRWALSLGVAEVHTAGVTGATGWNVKPTLLLEHLKAGHPSVTWLDADTVTHRDWRPRLGPEGAALVATEETFWGQEQGGTHRTVAWDLPVGRALARTVNTGLLRVGQEHIELLDSWASMLAAPTYLEAQQRPWHQRPLHLLGDQEVLTALLGSRRFSDLPIHLLRQGVDIAQCYGPAGYTPGARLRAVATRAGVPPLIHAMGVKPWEARRTREGFTGRARSHYEALHSLTSPYTIVASTYKDLIPSETPWLRYRPASTRNDIGASLTELPLAMFDHGVRQLRRGLRIGRYKVVGRPSSLAE